MFDNYVKLCFNLVRRIDIYEKNTSLVCPIAQCGHCKHEVQVTRKGNFKRHYNDGSLVPFYRLNPTSVCIGSITITPQKIEIIDADLFITL